MLWQGDAHGMNARLALGCAVANFLHVSSAFSWAPTQCSSFLELYCDTWPSITMTRLAEY